MGSQEEAKVAFSTGGFSRYALLVGPYAFKFPRIFRNRRAMERGKNWSLFKIGRQHNLREREISKTSFDRNLAYTFWSFFGLVNCQERASNPWGGEFGTIADEIVRFDYAEIEWPSRG